MNAIELSIDLETALGVKLLRAIADAAEDFHGETDEPSTHAPLVYATRVEANGETTWEKQDAAPVATSEVAAAADPEPAETAPDEAPKRRRGRPPKNAAPATDGEAAPEPAAESFPVTDVAGKTRQFPSTEHALKVLISSIETAETGEAVSTILGNNAAAVNYLAQAEIELVNKAASSRMETLALEAAAAKKAAAAEAEAPAPAPEPEQPKAAPPKAETTTEDKIRDAVNAIIGTQGAEAARTILRKFGGNRIGEIPKEKHDDLLAALEMAQ